VRCNGARTKKSDLNLPEEWTFPSAFETCPPIHVLGNNHDRGRRNGHPKSESKAESPHAFHQAALTAHRQGRCETGSTPEKFHHNLPGSSESASAGQKNLTSSNDEECARMTSIPTMSFDRTNDGFMNIDDSPLVSESDESKKKTSIKQPEKELCVHHTGFGNARGEISEPPHAPSTLKSSTPIRKRKGSSLYAPPGSKFVWAREGNHDGAKEHPAYLLTSPPRDSPTRDEDEGSKSENDNENGNADDSGDRIMEDCVWVRWAATGTIAQIPRSNVVLSEGIPSRRTRPQIRRDDKKQKNCKRLKETSAIQSNEPKTYNLGHLKPLFNG
jgi:hypothetical protein